jgi:hypothetical protein
VPFLLLLNLTPLAAAQAAAPGGGAKRQINLSPLAWFVGGTWTSEVRDAKAQTVTHVENRMTWSPNREAIEFQTDFDGTPHYNGFYAYNAASKAFNFYYTSSDGELTTGTATLDPDGKTIHQDFEITHNNGKTDHLQSTIVREGNDAYWLTVSAQKNGQSTQLFRIRYERPSEE